jgi:hypothetical protein
VTNVIGFFEGFNPVNQKFTIPENVWVELYFPKKHKKRLLIYGVVVV